MRDNASIFRPGAVRRYLDRRERTVFPVYAAPRTALCALLLAAILAVGLLLAALTKVPAYARGVAVLVGREGTAARASGQAEAAIFVSPEVLSEMKVGQRVFLRAGSTGWHYGGRIKALAPGEGGAQGAGALLNLDSVPGDVPEDRAAAALAGPLPPALMSVDEPGGVLEVRVEVGERWLLGFGRSRERPRQPARDGDETFRRG